MEQKRTLKRKILNILFWSVISAAFIGPGTVTTMTKAGVFYHYDLMWTIVFSIIACYVLQEASARLTILSGLNLGQAIAKHFENKKSKYLIFVLIIGAIILGSAAYETGNILGSVEGLAFILKRIPKEYFVLGIGIIAFFAFRMKSVRSIAQILGGFVYLMGLAFILTAVFVRPDLNQIIKGIITPTVPDVPGAGILILGIIGTTVVPYDLFLGSGIVDKTQTIREARIGLSIAIGLGGLISMSIMTVGNSITEGMTTEAIRNLDFNFSLMKSGLYLNTNIRDYAIYIFGFGMFAAGLTSAITAPLASAITAKNIFGGTDEDKKWQNKGVYFQLIAVGVLAVGFTFGMMQIKSVPAIIMAQAFNGFILPFISIFMLLIINNPEVMKDKINTHFSNILMAFVVWITLLIGTFNIFKAFRKIFTFHINQDTLFYYAATINLIITVFLMIKIYQKRRRYTENANIDA